MNVLLLGSGGREHAIAWKLKQSQELSELYIAPGNAGTSTCGTNVKIDTTNFNEIKNFCIKKNIEMVIVGPEDPLVNGIHDFFLQDSLLKKINVIGPTKQGAKLEGSKEFAKLFMERHNIPTAKYKSFTKENLHEGFDFLDNLNSPYVLKADGLAAGKGVLIINDINEAKKELEKMICAEKFGEASTKVVIEEFLDGIEMSVFVLTDGEEYVILPNAKDYKRIGENDTGLNTGGMGCISPVPFADDVFLSKVENQIIKPTINGLNKDSIKYRGFIFFGLIKVNNNPFIIEYNIRMGDPETEVVMPRLKSDLLQLFKASTNKTLDKIDVEFEKKNAATIILASGGYPLNYEKGKKITGLNNINKSLIFHAGTKETDFVETNGGRVLAVTGFGDDLLEATQCAYTDIKKINFQGMYYRTDIGKDVF